MQHLELKRDGLSILVLKYTVMTSRDTIIQPYSGRTVRQILYKIAEKEGIEKVIQDLEQKTPYKNYSITPIFINNKPLYKKPGTKTSLVLRAGIPYWFRYTVILTDTAYLDLLLNPQTEIQLYENTPTIIRLTQVNYYTEDSLQLNLKQGTTIKMNFITPTQLQYPKINKKSKQQIYAQYPEPRLIFHSLKEIWNRYAKQKITTAPWRANYAFQMIQSHIKTITVAYDKTRKITGFIGTITLKTITKNQKTQQNLGKLLALAKYTNIGKSRAIGLGYTKIQILNK